MILASSTDVASSDALQRLGAAVRAGRAAAGLTIEDAAERADVSPTTWGRVERAEDGVRRTTYLQVERVLGWDAGSVDAVLAGGEPTATGQPASGRSGRRRADHISEWERSIIDEIWSHPSLTNDQKEELAARARAKAAEARVVEDRLRRSA
jgi:transcriptional regulator with XRE-family HTH domain